MDIVARLARVIASGLGDDFDHAFASKTVWIAERGESGGRFRDVNEPMQPDYLEAARAAIAAMLEAVGEPEGWNYENGGSQIIHWDRLPERAAEGWTETPLYSLAALREALPPPPQD